MTALLSTVSLYVVIYYFRLKMKNIKYILFELHNNLLAKDKVSKIFKVLNVHNFILADKCFNSYYFKKTK